MAGISIYDAYIPLLSGAIDSLEAILTKAEEHAKENGINVDEAYISARIHEDMLPLSFQVWMVSGMTKTAISAVAGFGADKWSAEEKLESFADLHARLKKTRELVAAATPELVNGKTNEEVDFAFGKEAKKMSPQAGLTMILPVIFFHVVTAYDILRKEGVPLGKKDYIGPFVPQ